MSENGEREAYSPSSSSAALNTSGGQGMADEGNTTAGGSSSFATVRSRVSSLLTTSLGGWFSGRGGKPQAVRRGRSEMESDDDDDDNGEDQNEGVDRRRHDDEIDHHSISSSQHRGATSSVGGHIMYKPPSSRPPVSTARNMSGTQAGMNINNNHFPSSLDDLSGAAGANRFGPPTKRYKVQQTLLPPAPTDAATTASPMFAPSRYGYTQAPPGSVAKMRQLHLRHNKNQNSRPNTTVGNGSSFQSRVSAPSTSETSFSGGNIRRPLHALEERNDPAFAEERSEGDDDDDEEDDSSNHSAQVKASYCESTRGYASLMVDKDTAVSTTTVVDNNRIEQPPMLNRISRNKPAHSTALESTVVEKTSVGTTTLGLDMTADRSIDNTSVSPDNNSGSRPVSSSTRTLFGNYTSRSLFSQHSAANQSDHPASGGVITTQPRKSLSTRRPAFNVDAATASLGTSTFVDRTLSTSRILQSPFYNGPTAYGGSASVSRASSVASSVDGSSVHQVGVRVNDYRPPSSASNRSIAMNSDISHINRTNNNGYLREYARSTASDSSGGALSVTARRILETLESYAADVKKMPSDTSNSKSKKNPTAKRHRPYQRELQVPGIETLLHMKKRLQETTTSVRDIARSVEQRQTNTLSQLHPVASKTNTYSLPPNATSTSPNKTTTTGGKIRTRLRQKNKSGGGDNDSTSSYAAEVPDLPDIQLPITSLPKFDLIGLAPPPAVTATSSIFSKATTTVSKTTNDGSTASSSSSFAAGSASGGSIFHGVKASSSSSSIFGTGDASNYTLLPESAAQKAALANFSFAPASKIGSSPSAAESTSQFSFSKPQVLCSDKTKQREIRAINDFKFSLPTNMRHGDLGSSSDATAPSSSSTNSENATSKFSFGGTAPVPEISASADSSPPTNETSKMKNSKDATEKTSSLPFNFKTPASGWECSVCMIRNADARNKCEACESSRPGTNTTKLSLTEAKSASSLFEGGPTLTLPPTIPVPQTNGFGAQFKPTAGSWTCDSCMLVNGEDVSKCVACSSGNPKNSSSSTASSATSTGENKKWECPCCMVPNSSERTMCECCSAQRPDVFKKPIGSAVAAALPTISKFNFGITPPGTKITGAGFTFGIPAGTQQSTTIAIGTGATSTTTNASPASSLKPSNSATPSSLPTFTFGIPATKTAAISSNSATKPIALQAPSATVAATTALGTAAPTFTFGIAPAASKPVTTTSSTIATTFGTSTVTASVTAADGIGASNDKVDKVVSKPSTITTALPKLGLPIDTATPTAKTTAMPPSMFQFVTPSASSTAVAAVGGSGAKPMAAATPSAPTNTAATTAPIFNFGSGKMSAAIPAPAVGSSLFGGPPAEKKDKPSLPFSFGSQQSTNSSTSLSTPSSMTKPSPFQSPMSAAQAASNSTAITSSVMPMFRAPAPSNNSTLAAPSMFASPAPAVPNTATAAPMFKFGSATSAAVPSVAPDMGQPQQSVVGGAAPMFNFGSGAGAATVPTAPQSSLFGNACLTASMSNNGSMVGGNSSASSLSAAPSTGGFNFNLGAAPSSTAAGTSGGGSASGGFNFGAPMAAGGLAPPAAAVGVFSFSGAANGPGPATGTAPFTFSGSNAASAVGQGFPMVAPTGAATTQNLFSIPSDSTTPQQPRRVIRKALRRTQR